MLRQLIPWLPSDMRGKRLWQHSQQVPGLDLPRARVRRQCVRTGQRAAQWRLWVEHFSWRLCFKIIPSVETGNCLTGCAFVSSNVLWRCHMKTLLMALAVVFATVPALAETPTKEAKEFADKVTVANKF